MIMSMKCLLSTIAMFAVSQRAVCQQAIPYDDTQPAVWEKEFKEVAIPSSADRIEQKAYFHASTGKQKRPLIVSLHTWSGDYTQDDPLAEQCLLNNWNYIHPDFRGPNWTVQACGSPLVLSDIDDAIGFAIERGNVDLGEIHVIGVSGGGYATLLTFLNTKYPVKTFSAWASISDLERWYYESRGRDSGYADHILKSTSSKEGVLNAEEAKKRSPMYGELPSDLASRGKLFIDAGIHDGYTGSVPITHSIVFYNRMVKALGGGERESVPESDIIEMVTSRMCLSQTNEGCLADRKIHYRRKFKNVQLLIFEGGHEMLPSMALQHVPGRETNQEGESDR